MRSAQFILFFTLQMQVFGIFFHSRFAKRYESHPIGGSREIPQPDPKGVSRIGLSRRPGRLGNLTQENANGLLRINSQNNGNISRPAVNLAHRSSSTNAKGFWNQFMFRGKSGFRFVLPINNVEVRQEKCRALTFSQRIFHENCETLEVQNNVCFGKCYTAPSRGDEGGSLSCSVCTPVIITSKTVKLKCTENTEMIKVVKIIEDCQCKIKEGQHSHQTGPVLVDPSVHQYPQKR
ncbi:cerberus-like [Carassius gibelio]|uniref:cerberus-like n=1 Tax=Carassius gibelio TaxID=101364 RepID=UPI0022777E62|nr:cerberus-like [Carassius gibelio]